MTYYDCSLLTKPRKEKGFQGLFEKHSPKDWMSMNSFSSPVTLRREGRLLSGALVSVSSSSQLLWLQHPSGENLVFLLSIAGLEFLIVFDFNKFPHEPLI